MSTPSQISVFLNYLKQAVEKNGFVIVDRKATNQFMADRNMTYDELREIILSLEVKDCFDGPEPDRDPRFKDKWTVAEFAPIYHGEKLYLKMSVRIDLERSKCLSVKLFTEKEGN